MKSVEIKEMVEKVVRTEYVAEDGKVFFDAEECKKYEESALFVLNKQLKRLGLSEKRKRLYHADIDDDTSYDNEVEIFDIQTEDELITLKRYLYLESIKNGATESSIASAFEDKENIRGWHHTFDNVTAGHEVMIFWNYDKDYFWVYNDGSINGYCEFFRNKITDMLYPKEIDTTEKERN